MDISVVDVIIHMEEAIADERMHELQDVLRTDDGVISACSSSDNPHMLLVTYNPAATTSGTVLNMIQAQGLRANLVGL